MFRKKFVSTLVALRKEKNMSQEDLATRCDIDRTYISGIERMKRNFTIDSLEKIVKGLGMTLDGFLSAVAKNLK